MMTGSPTFSESEKGCLKRPAQRSLRKCFACSFQSQQCDAPEAILLGTAGIGEQFVTVLDCKLLQTRPVSHAPELLWLARN